MSQGIFRRFFSGDSLDMRAARGTVLTVFNFGGSQMLRLGSNLVLTRLLVPEAFGLMALVQVVILGLGMFTVTGVKSSIVQNKRGDDADFLDTAWVVQIARGVILWLLVCLFAGPAANLYGQPMLSILLPVAAFTAVLAGFQSTNMSSANRHLTLGRRTFVEIGSQALGVAIIIVATLITQSVWGLIIGSLATELLKTLFSHWFLPGHRNRFRWDQSAFSEIFKFGKYIFLGSIAGFLINTGDRAVLGKYVTLSELAVYNIGFFLATVPVKLSNKICSMVLFSFYARAKEDHSAQSRTKQMKARLIVTGSILVVAILFAAIGDGLVRFMYPEAYHLAGPLMVLIALAHLPILITHGYAQQLLAMGNSRDMTNYTVFQAIAQITILLFAVQAYGLIGAVIAGPLAVVLTYPFMAWLVYRKDVWEPKSDMLFGGLAVVGTVFVLWVNDTAILQVLRGTVE